MNADPDDQLRLLDVQGLDLGIAQLAHRRKTLPELEQIDALRGRDGAIGDDIVRAETEDSDLGREQAKVDADVEIVRGRMTRDQQRLDFGQVGSPRELENLQSEIQSLHRRQAELEDIEIDVMERREVFQLRVKDLQAEREQLVAALSAAEHTRDATFAEIDAETQKSAADRSALAATLPQDLLTLYEKLRESSAGIGAARLHRGRCEGCHIQLNTTDINRLRDAPAQEVARCEECRRILIRTAESGL